MKVVALDDARVHPWPSGRIDTLARQDPVVFRRDVVHALRHLHHREVLAQSPLVRATFVLRRSHHEGETSSVRLRNALVAAIRELAAMPEDRRSAALLEAAFVVVPRRKQLVLAAELCMGFSTYRRHLAAAIDALVDVLRVADPP